VLARGAESPRSLEELQMRLSRPVVACAIVVVLALHAGAAHAQAYPTKPVRMIVGFPPGGGTDILARIVAQKLSDAWGQQIVVENRPGASATIGANAVARSAPDGYTLLMGQLTSNAIAPALYPKLPYDALRDLVPITLVGTSPNVLVVNPAVPAKSLAELVANAKAQPGRLTYASSGPGSLQHIAAELFKSMAGVDLVHVPFKGSGQAIVDLVAGQVDMNFDAIPPTIQHIRSGKLRPLAVTSARRASGLMDVPTIAESGYPGYDLTTWWGLFAPTGTPNDVLERVHADSSAALRNPEVRERFGGLSVEPGGGSRSEFAGYVREEVAKYDKLVKQLGIKVE
jgi:tripartite-type tricarboxylate transporter receptor subunit TctC